MARPSMAPNVAARLQMSEAAGQRDSGCPRIRPSAAPSLKRGSDAVALSAEDSIRSASCWLSNGRTTTYVGAERQPKVNEPASQHWQFASSLTRVRGLQPKRQKMTDPAETDEDCELDFLYFVEDRLRHAGAPMSIHAIRKDFLPEWRKERPWNSDEKMSAVRLSKALLEEHSDSLVWIPGPGEDELNRADYVGWDPDNSAIALEALAAESGDGPDDPGRALRHLGEVNSFSMRTGWGYISCKPELPGVGRQILFYQAALPGILATCQLGGNHAVRKNTWFKGLEVTFALDSSAGKPQAKDVKFVRQRSGACLSDVRTCEAAERRVRELQEVIRGNQ